MEPTEKIRLFCQECMHNPTYRWAKWVNGFIAFLVVLSVAIIPLHFMPGLEWTHNWLFFFEKIAVSIFTVEYFLRTWSAKKPLRYVFSWWGLVDLVAIVPFYLGELDLISHPEVFMALRILRLFKLGKIYEAERELTATEAKEYHGRFFSMGSHEYIEYIVQKHWVVFIASLSLSLIITTAGILSLVMICPINMVIGLVVGILFLIFATALFTKLWLDFNYDLIYITNHRVVFQQRELFGAHLNESHYENITNVIPNDTGIWHWVFGFGDITIETPAAQGTMHFPHAKDPAKACNIISKNRLKAPHRILESVPAQNAENNSPIVR